MMLAHAPLAVGLFSDNDTSFEAVIGTNSLFVQGPDALQNSSRNEDVFMKNDKLALGVSYWGVFGTEDGCQGIFASNFGESCTTDGLGVLSRNLGGSGKLFHPGNQFDGWTVGHSGGPDRPDGDAAAHEGYAYRRFDGEFTFKGVRINQLTHEVNDDVAYATHVATTSDHKLQVTSVAMLGGGETDIVPLRITIKNIDSDPVHGVFYSRLMDPDQDPSDPNANSLDKNLIRKQDAKAGSSIVASSGDSSLFFHSNEPNTTVTFRGSHDPLTLIDFGDKNWPLSKAYLQQDEIERAVGMLLKFGTLAPGEEKTKLFYIGTTAPDDIDAAVSRIADDLDLEVAAPDVPDVTGNQFTVHGDPIFTHDGKGVQFVINSDIMTPLLTWKAGHSRFVLSGKTFDTSGDATAHGQWFDRFIVTENEKTVLDVTAQKTGTGTMMVQLDGMLVHEKAAPKGSSKLFASAEHAVKVKAIRRPERHHVGHKHAEKLQVVAGGLHFAIYSSKAAKFDAPSKQIKHMHLNLKFKKGLPKDAKGVFAELVGVSPMSKATSALLKPTKRMLREARGSLQAE